MDKMYSRDFPKFLRYHHIHFQSLKTETADEFITKFHFLKIETRKKVDSIIPSSGVIE